MASQDPCLTSASGWDNGEYAIPRVQGNLDRFVLKKKLR
jgi:hypothetical protein